MDQDHFNAVKITHASSAAVPAAYYSLDGEPLGACSATTDANAVVTRNQTDDLWVRVQFDGADLTVRQADEKADLNDANACCTVDANDLPDTAGGKSPTAEVAETAEMIHAGSRLRRIATRRRPRRTPAVPLDSQRPAIACFFVLQLSPFVIPRRGGSFVIRASSFVIPPKAGQVSLDNPRVAPGA